MASAHAHAHAPSSHGHGHGSSHDDTLLYPQFDDLAQQHESSNLGMWAFLATEVLFFGGALSAFAIANALHPTAFRTAAHHLNVPLGAVNTAVLLVSSLTMALAVHASQLRDRVMTVRWLLATVAVGAVFLGIKAYEWFVDYEEGFIPFAGLWNSEGKAGSDTEAIFWSFYFTLTGLHAIHMIIGIALILIMAVMVRTKWFTGCGSTQIEMLGLYWHFVDIAWVFLFPILYLINLGSH